MLIVSAIVSGLSLGAMYGLIALGYHVTYAVSNTVNFAQGSSVMLGAVLCYSLWITFGLPLPLALLCTLLLAALFGLLVERFLVRPFASRGSNAWLMATVAGGIILDNAVMFTFGKEPRALPSALATTPVNFFGAGVYPLQLVIPVVGIAIAVALHVLLNRTAAGKRLLAVVQNPAAARLMGIDVKRAIALAFAASAVLAAVGGMLIAPLLSVSSDMGLMFGIKAFAVAILGGIGSASGIMAAGFLYGLAEALITSYLGSSYTQILVFSAVIAALALMPNGLFGRAAVKKV